jgi:hypothetical protein
VSQSCVEEGDEWGAVCMSFKHEMILISSVCACVLEPDVFPSNFK